MLHGIDRVMKTGISRLVGHVVRIGWFIKCRCNFYGETPWRV